MNMSVLIKNISSLVTVNSKGKGFKAGKTIRDLGEIQNGAMLFSDKIEWLGTNYEAEMRIENQDIKPEKIFSAQGKTIMPGFVDSHTHIVFAGNRSFEFAKRLRGATYQEIAAAGGGIQATLKATRNATVDELVANGTKLAMSAINHGTTAMEIKTGYGLTIESEMKMLRAIDILKKTLPIDITATFLGAHDFPPEFKADKQKYIDLICNELLPMVAESGIATYCDAFVDRGFYTISQAEQIFNRAKELGLKIKIHADELFDVDAAGLAAKVGAVSSDHNLFISDKNIEALKNAGTVITLMPGTAYFIHMPYAPARKIIDSGAIVALATDCNPGSCYTENMQMVLSLAVINMKMTAEEAIAAATINGAKAIEKSKTMGSLETGKCANFIITNTSSFTEMLYHFGLNHVEQTWVNGERIS